VDRELPDRGVLGYALPKGHALIDRRLYLPKDWAEDQERRKKIHVPDEISFTTKPKIGTAMVEAYVLAVRSDEKLTTDSSFQTRTVQEVAKDLAAQDWHRLPAGQGSKGPRLYDWARVRLFRLQAPPWDHWLLIRRSISNPQDMAFYVTFGPHTTDLKELAAVAGLRWTIEECFQSAKGETGLDHCEARSWHGWHRHMTLSCWPLLFLPVWAPACWTREARAHLTKRTKGVYPPLPDRNHHFCCDQRARIAQAHHKLAKASTLQHGLPLALVILAPPPPSRGKRAHYRKQKAKLQRQKLQL
jgi:hypothetical protein